MAKRQRKWAKRAYEKLILQLGGRCTRCGALSALSIHHTHGRTWDVAKVEWSARISIYRREAMVGLLEVLCIKCNSAVGDPREVPVFGLSDDNQFDLFVPEHDAWESPNVGTPAPERNDEPF